MVTVLNYRWLANPWECFYSLSTVIGRWAVWTAWQSAAFRVIVSLGSSAQGQDCVPELPEAASSLFRRNLFSLGLNTKQSISEHCYRAYSSASAGNLSLNREARHLRGCRHRGESDGRSRVWAPGLYTASVSDIPGSCFGPALISFRVPLYNIASKHYKHYIIWITKGLKWARGTL